MKTRFIQTVESFSSEAKRLRAHYDSEFKDPLKTQSTRFSWDYWHVPDQYTHLRTPAAAYFPKKVISKFTQELTLWGQENLGCLSISPPWLSYYVEGCEQKLHCDNPHGPWAFVFSLTQGITFDGGETIIFKPEHLSFWKNFSIQRGFEQEDLFHKIAPKFNRLIVFDPRLPHGVSRVNGTQDPQRARVVIHGWFTQPQPIINGSISINEVNQNLNSLLASLEKTLAEVSSMTGTQSYRLHILPSGKVSRVVVLTNTLMSREGEDTHVRALTKWLMIQMQNFNFKKHSRSSIVTLPLIFE